jgi:SPP1 gp7 family putative phage head morphogenesis protein
MVKRTKAFRPTTVNEKLVDKFIRHSVYIDRLAEGEAADIAKHLNREVFPVLYDKLIAGLSKVPLNQKRYAMKRLREMVQATDKLIAAGMVKAGNASVQRLQSLALYEADWVGKTVSKTVPLDITMNMPSRAALEAIVTTKPMQGKKLKTWFKGYSKSVKANIAKQARIGISTGESISQIGRRLKSTLKGKSTSQIKAVARTAVQETVGRARQMTYAKNKDLISSWQFVATLDMRTTLVCIDNDGKVFSIGDGPQPPIHFQCRSTSVPVIKAWQELGIDPPPAATRASMNGAVSDKVTYKEWLAGKKDTAQGRRDIMTVLGKKRGEAFIKGTPITSMVDRNKKPISIDRLPKSGKQVRQEIVKKFGKVTEIENKLHSLQDKFMKADQSKWSHIDAKKTLDPQAPTYWRDRKILSTKIEAKHQAMEKLNSEMNKVQARIDKLKAAARKSLVVPNNAKGMIPVIAENPRWAPCDEVLSWIPRSRIPKVKHNTLKRLSFVDETAKVGSGGHYKYWNQTIAVGKNSSEACVAHEFGHHLGFSIDDINDAGQKFFERRTKGEAVSNWGYQIQGSKVVGKKDNFKTFSQYGGRVYDGHAWEIPSVGIEHIFMDPIKAAQADPEWFDLMINQLRGIG